MSQIACRIVEVCVFKYLHDKPLYLLLHRSKDEKVYPGIWQLISGSIEGGEKAYEAALRELREETDLGPLRFWVVPFTSTFYDLEHDAVNLSPMFAAQIDEMRDPTISREHEEFGWFSLEEALSLLVWPGQRSGLQIVHQYITHGEKAAHLSELNIPTDSGES